MVWCVYGCVGRGEGSGEGVCLVIVRRGGCSIVAYPNGWMQSWTPGYEEWRQRSQDIEQAKAFTGQQWS